MNRFGFLASLALALGCACSQMPIVGSYDTALRARDRGDFELATSLFEQGTRESPDDYHCWNGLAEMRLYSRDYAAAEQASGKAIELAPTYGPAYYVRSKARSHHATTLTARKELAALDMDGALADMTQAVELDCKPARFERAQLFAIRGEFARAREDIEFLIAKEPKNLEYVGMRCFIHVLAGDEAAAAADKERVVRGNPDWLPEFVDSLPTLRMLRDGKL